MEALGLCHTHYLRQRKGLPLDAPIRPHYAPGQLCSWPTCQESVVSSGYCDAHYRRFIGRSKTQMGAPIRVRVKTYDGVVCSEAGCLERPVSDSLCGMHYQRMRLGIDMDKPRARRYGADEVCAVPWCQVKPATNGYCLNHAARDQQLLTRYGLSIARYLAILEQQDGKCAVCGKSEPGGSSKTALGFHVDHDHWCCPGKTSCGRCVRFLLCNACNRNHFADDLVLVRRRLELDEAFRVANPWIVEKHNP